MDPCPTCGATGSADCLTASGAPTRDHASRVRPVDPTVELDDAGDLADPVADATVTATSKPIPIPIPSRSAKNMPTTTFKIEKGELGFSLTDPGDPVADATIADYTAYSCLVTSGQVTSSANFSTDPIPGTFCDPEAETVTPSAATFTLEVEVLQDPQDPAGLADFLWQNDSGVSGSPVWFYLGLAEGAAPKIIGQCYLSPMDFGGEARTVLTASLSFPIEGRPNPEFGTTADA